jgi:hypothetical protein
MFTQPPEPDWFFSPDEFTEADMFIQPTVDWSLSPTDFTNGDMSSFFTTRTEGDPVPFDPHAGCLQSNALDSALPAWDLHDMSLDEGTTWSLSGTEQSTTNVIQVRALTTLDNYTFMADVLQHVLRETETWGRLEHPNVLTPHYSAKRVVFAPEAAPLWGSPAPPSHARLRDHLDKFPGTNRGNLVRSVVILFG